MDDAAEVVRLTGLIGIIIDVSGSMQVSVRNDSGTTTSRLGSLRDIIVSTKQRTSSAVRAAYPTGLKTDLNVFAYAFGLRGLPVPVCDLLSLLTLSAEGDANPLAHEGSRGEAPVSLHARTEVGSPSRNVYEELESLARSYDRYGWGEIARDYLTPEGARNALARLRSQPALAQELARLLPRLTTDEVQAALEIKGNRMMAAKYAALNPKRALELRGKFGGKSREIHQVVTHLGRPLDPSESEADNISHLREGVAQQIRSAIATLGDTTLRLEDVITLLGRTGEGFSSIEDYIYGNTPMCAAIEEVAGRLHRELNRNPALARPVIVMVSDGNSTDGDPSSLFSQIKSTGATIICCYVTDRDILTPFTLPAAPDPSWDSGAKLLFDCSSPVIGSDAYMAYLLRNRWTIEDGGKYFVQANHSNVISKIFEMVLQ